jgi:hypothetical protein
MSSLLISNKCICLPIMYLIDVNLKNNYVINRYELVAVKYFEFSTMF